jgi:hypothetical protein
MGGWGLGQWVVEPCTECPAPGDTPCRKDCSNRDFRDAEFADVDGEWPTDNERYE